MRSIKKLHKAEYRPIADLSTYSPLPTRSLDQIDPFLFLNHHGPQTYQANNNGLPFGPHPHRGMETVTFIIDGDIMHKDSGGHESIITAGGVQWMTAGKGLIHAEVSSDDFQTKGGNLEILQLWVNLPASLKMTTPKYLGLQKEEIPQISLDEDRVEMNLVSGTWEDRKSAFETLTPIHLSTVRFAKDGSAKFTIPKEHNIFFYVIQGSLEVNGNVIQSLHLAEFNHDGDTLEIRGLENSLLLLGHAKPFEEPVVAQGPFVMNTNAEIQQAYEDYQNGVFGSWNG